MTTTAEVKQLVERYPVEADRVVLSPSALLTREEGLDELAREVVALANHEGGRVVLGVSESGIFEGRLALEREAVAAAFEELRESRILPRPNLSLEHLAGDEGELVVLTVERRAGAPHAVARKLATGGVLGRSYFVREGRRTRPVPDERLAWMFRVVGDPALRVESDLELQLLAGAFELDLRTPQPAAAGRFRPLVGAVGGALGNSSDLEARGRALNELASWAFLQEVAEACEEAGLDTEEVALDDLPVPERRSVFSMAAGPGLRALLDGERRRGGIAGLFGRRSAGRAFRLPVDAEPQVDFLGRQGKGRVLLAHPAFVLAFSSRLEATGEGPVPTLAGRGTPDAEWVRLAVALNVSLRWDDQLGGAAERLGRTLAGRIESCWSSRRWAAGIDPAWTAATDRSVSGWRP